VFAPSIENLPLSIRATGVPEYSIPVRGEIDEPASGLQNAAQLAQGTINIIDILKDLEEATASKDAAEYGKSSALATCSSTAESPEHASRNGDLVIAHINGISPAGGADGLGNLFDEKAAAAPHLENVFASSRCKSCKRYRASRRIIRGLRSGLLNLRELASVMHGPTISVQVDD
jgi:hypothetical protein